MQEGAAETYDRLAEHLETLKADRSTRARSEPQPVSDSGNPGKASPHGKEVRMSESTIAVIAIAVMVAVTGYLIGSMAFSIRKEKRSANLRKTWANFALSLAFCSLFLVSWAAQGLAQWDDYRRDQQAHQEPVDTVEFINEFSQATLENWQSEFLQLFSFVVLSALLIHHGSAESKDSDDRMERKIDEIHQRVKEMSGG
jgi:hypothetical protein